MYAFNTLLSLSFRCLLNISFTPYLSVTPHSTSLGTSLGIAS